MWAMHLQMPLHQAAPQNGSAGWHLRNPRRSHGPAGPVAVANSLRYRPVRSACRAARSAPPVSTSKTLSTLHFQPDSTATATVSAFLNMTALGSGIVPVPTKVVGSRLPTSSVRTCVRITCVRITCVNGATANDTLHRPHMHGDHRQNRGPCRLRRARPSAGQTRSAAPQTRRQPAAVMAPHWPGLSIGGPGWLRSGHRKHADRTVTGAGGRALARNLAVTGGKYL